MTGLTFWQAVMRQVFSSDVAGALELTTVIFAVMIFVGVSYGARVGSHGHLHPADQPVPA